MTVSNSGCGELIEAIGHQCEADGARPLTLLLRSRGFGFMFSFWR
jgi:hypothetical protein